MALTVSGAELQQWLREAVAMAVATVTVVEAAVGLLRVKELDTLGPRTVTQAVVKGEGISTFKACTRALT